MSSKLYCHAVHLPPATSLSSCGLINCQPPPPSACQQWSRCPLPSFLSLLSSSSSSNFSSSSPVNRCGPLVVTCCQVVLPTLPPPPLLCHPLPLPPLPPFHQSMWPLCSDSEMSLWVPSAVLTSATDPETWLSFSPSPVALQSPSLLFLP